MSNDIIPTYRSVVHTFTNILEIGGNIRDVTVMEQSLKTSSQLNAQNLIVVTDFYYSADEIDDDVLEVFSEECDSKSHVLVEMLKEEIPDFFFPGFSLDVSFISAMSSPPSATETLVSEQVISALVAAVSTCQTIFSFTNILLKTCTFRLLDVQLQLLLLLLYQVGQLSQMSCI